MSEKANNLFRQLYQNNRSRIGKEVAAELGRMGRQGGSELAAALFSGNAFVIYGSGQRPAEMEAEREPSQQHERDGRGRE